jgi:hypothetical protein
MLGFTATRARDCDALSSGPPGAQGERKPGRNRADAVENDADIDYGVDEVELPGMGRASLRVQAWERAGF